MVFGRPEIVFTLLPEHRLCLFYGRGLITLGDIIEGVGRVNAHPDFRHDFSTLICFEEATVSFGEGDLERYRAFFQQHQEGRTVSRWALVAGDEITASTSRLAHLIGERMRIGVKTFRDRRKALRWLGRPLPLASRSAPWEGDDAS